MTRSSLETNLVIFGASLQAFAAVVALLFRHNALWSSVCDKYGDWMISTQDDGLTELLAEQVMAIPGVESIVRGGEIATLLESHPEYEALFHAPELARHCTGDP